MAAPYKLHGGNGTTRSLHAWNECTKRECAKDVLWRAGAHEEHEGAFLRRRRNKSRRLLVLGLLVLGVKGLTLQCDLHAGCSQWIAGHVHAAAGTFALAENCSGHNIMTIRYENCTGHMTIYYEICHWPCDILRPLARAGAAGTCRRSIPMGVPALMLPEMSLANATRRAVRDSR